MCPDENVGDGYDRFYRISPMLFITVSLVLPQEQKEYLTKLIRLAVSNEQVTRQYVDGPDSAPWGRYLFKATGGKIIEFRSKILEGRYTDDDEPLQILHHLSAVFTKLLEGGVVQGYSYAWELAALPSHYLIPYYFTSVSLMLKSVYRGSKASDLAIQIATRSGASDSSIYVAGLAVNEPFPLWDAMYFPDCFMQPFAPYFQSFDDGFCYKRMFIADTYGLGPWTDVGTLRQRNCCNIYMRCFPITKFKWHVVSFDTQWNSAMKPFCRLDSDYVVGGTNSEQDFSQVRLDSSADLMRFSRCLQRIRMGTHHADYIDAILPVASAPYSSCVFLSGVFRSGYFLSPLVLRNTGGMISFKYRFTVDVSAVFLKGNSFVWYDLSNSENLSGSVFSISFSNRFPVLLVVLTQRDDDVVHSPEEVLGLEYAFCTSSE